MKCGAALKFVTAKADDMGPESGPEHYILWIFEKLRA